MIKNLKPEEKQSSFYKRGLGKLITEYLKEYLEYHGGHLPPTGLYNLIIAEVEKPLILYVLESVNGNQSKAAKILGLNRNTIRKKLQEIEESSS